MDAEVIVVGGGLAGLAASAALAEHGVQVLLLESRPRLGGRASSFLDQSTGERIDNCQHVSMGCCTNFRHLMRMFGNGDCFRTEEELYFIDRDGVVNRFASSWLPAPLHHLFAFQKLSYFSRKEKRRLAKGLKKLSRWRPGLFSTDSFQDWLIEHQQPESVLKKFWEVVLVSALSESLDRIETSYARKVFADGFLANREGWKVEIPTVPLDDLYGDQLLNWFAARHGSVQLQTGISKLHEKDGQVSHVELRDGRSLTAEHFVLATPFHLLESLLPASLSQREEFQQVDQLETAPISSVHLWFDRPITDLPHAVLIDRLSQWVFNRTLLQGDPSTSERHAVQVVISASRHVKTMSQEEVVSAVVAELREVWPESSKAKLLHSRMVTEHKAVFSVLPGAEDLRLPQQSPLENLQLAGDWTKTGWPSTMEGAVRSGFLAAENVLTHFGKPAPVLQPDLPVRRLSRLLLGL